MSPGPAYSRGAHGGVCCVVRLDNPPESKKAGAVAEFERSMILERQREGIAIAKAKGKYKGRKKALDSERVAELKKLKAEGVSVTKLANDFGISRQSVYNYLG